jgi:aspartyl-tRNA synthetase
VTTININGYEVPMPEREAPEGGTEYFFPSFQQEGGVYSYTWSGDAYDNRLLSAGMVHLTEEAAQKHAEALASFTRKQ